MRGTYGRPSVMVKRRRKSLFCEGLRKSKQKVDEFHKDLVQLFDIASSTIPLLENSSFEDQKKIKQMYIGTENQEMECVR